MKCPMCHQDNDRVSDSRTCDNGLSIRRRRVCLSCDTRFTTYERIERTVIKVVKRDGSREPFDSQKIKHGLERACWKRPISDLQLSALVSDIEVELETSYDTEVESLQVGQMVMERLRDLDQVAFVRFASVYRQFNDIQDFIKELEPMIQK